MGQAVNEGGMPITATLSNNDYMYYIKVNDNRDGTYSAFYTLGHPGIFDLHIKLNDEHDIFGSPFRVEMFPTRTLSTACTAEGDGLVAVVANSTSSFTIIARDLFGNRKSKGNFYEAFISMKHFCDMIAHKRF